VQFLNNALLILKKDLQIEFRQRSLLLSMLVFSILIQVIMIISFDAKKEAMQNIAPGLLWLPILLSAMIGFNRYGSSERENGALTGLLVSPIDRGALFIGKLAGNLLLVFIVAGVSVPAFFLFLKQPAPESIGLLITTLVLGGWGFVAAGVFLSFLATTSSISELLMPLMLFPLSIPLLIAIVSLTEMSLYPSVDAGQSLWLTLLIAYNVIFTVIPLLLFDVLLEG
jgi:heme exporter protein B